MQIKPQLFQWAQERSGISGDELCAKFPKYPQWLTGESGPTMKQLEKFAAQTYTPLGYFFLNEPPEERLPIPDFRTVTDRSVAQPSPHLLDTIYAVQLRQDWMRGFLIEQGEAPLAFVGSRTLQDSPDAVAAEIRQTLDLNTGWSRKLGDWEEALRTLIIISNLLIPVPPQAEQNLIAAHLHTQLAKLDTLTAEAQRAIDLLQERRTALISAAVTGQIDVRPLSKKQPA